MNYLTLCLRSNPSGIYETHCENYQHNIPYKRCEIKCDTNRFHDPAMKFSTDLIIMLSNLTHLKISETFIKIGNLRDLIEFKMQKLVHLELDGGSYEFLTIIKGHKIQSFVYNHEGYVIQGHEPFNGVLKEFLTTCTQLKHLIFNRGFLNFDFSGCSFKLKSLEIRQFAKLNRNFINLLRTQLKRIRWRRWSLRFARSIQRSSISSISSWI